MIWRSDPIPRRQKGRPFVSVSFRTENTRAPEHPHPDYLTVRDVMASLQVSRDTVYRILARGELPHLYTGARSIRIRRDAFDAWRRDQEERA